MRLLNLEQMLARFITNEGYLSDKEVVKRGILLILDGFVVLEGEKRLIHESNVGLPRLQVNQIHHRIADFVDSVLGRVVPIEVMDVPIYRLHPTQKNADPEKVKMFMDTKSFAPIVVSGDLQIIDGHHRYAAAMKRGDAKIPCKVLDVPYSSLISLAGVK